MNVSRNRWKKCRLGSRSVRWFTHNWLNKHTQQGLLMNKCQQIVRSLSVLSPGRMLQHCDKWSGEEEGWCNWSICDNIKPGTIVKSQNNRSRILDTRAMVPTACTVHSMVCPDNSRRCAWNHQNCVYHTHGDRTRAVLPGRNCKVEQILGWGTSDST